MVSLLQRLPIVLLSLATSAQAHDRYSTFYDDDDCKKPLKGSFSMGNTGCFNVGHKLSYATGNSAVKAPEGKWCLIKYRDDTCECIDDYEVIDLDAGDDTNCHTLAYNPYHGSYHWAQIGDDGKCPISGCYPNDVNRDLPDYENKAGQAHKKSVTNEGARGGFAGP